MKRYILVVGLERFLRNLATGYLAVVVPLYLKDLTGSALAAGLAVTAAGFISLGTSILYAALGDVIGHARGLAVSEAAFASALVAIAASRNPWAIGIALGIGGIGMLGPGSTRGSFVPLIMALVRRHTSNAVERTRDLGLVNLLSTAGGIAGSLLVALVTLREASILFVLLVSAAALLVLLSLGRGEEVRRVNPFTAVGRRGSAVLAYSLSQLVAGIGIGLSNSLLSLWMNAYLGMGPAVIGVVYAVGNAAFSLSSLFAHIFVRWFGLVKASAASRFASGALLASLPFIPHPAAFAAAYALYNAMVGIGGTARSSYISGAAAEGGEATTPAVASISMRIAATPSAAAAGYLIEVGPALLMPIAGAFVIAAGYIFLRYLKEEE
ncbi:major facilitator superfamily MFS_1 [Thermoproteus uzoniensis 768-20]|uniref:Major facilitator superfamily MFS_1 n=1 Tax=Thermoproteus uzoniensis (strain 768-20) TaxID=999630 RepID=F2L4Z9_THEU7|nr:MFS transporter [Thermoproteus uzoniensis]AEA12248.1 major facilitator superfamily MFS_1 [Thermoproteus uzoniensis 768-20]